MKTLRSAHLDVMITRRRRKFLRLCMRCTKQIARIFTGRRMSRSAKRRGAESLELMVWSFNKSAMRFYESAGVTVRSLVMEKKL